MNGRLNGAKCVISDLNIDGYGLKTEKISLLKQKAMHYRRALFRTALKWSCYWAGLLRGVVANSTNVMSATEKIKSQAIYNRVQRVGTKLITSIISFH